MVDETTNMSKVEQVVVCLGLVSEKFEIREEFVGLYEIASTGAEIIYEVIADVFVTATESFFGSRPVLRQRCYHVWCGDEIDCS